jgi:hypothetical protein
MEIWLIRNGEKSGPYQDYVVRSKVGDGDLKEDDHAWHEGLGGWKRLGDMELFEEEFRQRRARAVPPPLPEMRQVVGEVPIAPVGGRLYLGRRFWARWLDLVCFGAFWWLGMYLAGRDIGAAVRNDWLHLTIFVPWFLIEAFLIRKLGTTPGKWMLGLRVVNEDGTNLSQREALWRSIRVMVTGVGFGWGILALCCQGLSWVTTRWVGKPVWDHLGKHKVEAKPMKPLGIIMLVVLYVAASHLKVAVVGPHAEERFLEVYPQMQEFFDKQPNWYFPVKGS